MQLTICLIVLMAAAQGSGAETANPAAREEKVATAGTVES
jgi:hypothetical protein